MNAMRELEEQLLPDHRAEEKAPYVGFLNILLFCGTIFVFGFVCNVLECVGSFALCY